MYIHNNFTLHEFNPIEFTNSSYPYAYTKL